MKVLIACEYSGIVREAFKNKGHDAVSCDIIPTEIVGNHIQDDVLKHLDKQWDLMIAHPPCTYLSNAGARFLYPKGELNKAIPTSLAYSNKGRCHSHGVMALAYN